MDIFKAIFGELFWPVVGLFSFAVLCRTAFAIWEAIGKNLVLVVVATVSLHTAQADEIPYEPIIPSDLTNALGDWGGGTTSTLLGELHLIRELQLLELKILVMGFGAFLAYMVVGQIKPQ